MPCFFLNFFLTVWSDVLSYHEVEDVAEGVRPEHAPVVAQRVQVEVPGH
jgi:hypothetical protein